ncbi:MAG TPA: hypothetical protein VH561_04295 [Micromonosporaceae bacterium]
MVHISQAENTVVPAILALEAMGMRIEVHAGRVVASSDLGRFTADDPVCVLGLVALVRSRGENWQASEEEITSTLRRFAQL